MSIPSLRHAVWTICSNDMQYGQYVAMTCSMDNLAMACSMDNDMQYGQSVAMACSMDNCSNDMQYGQYLAMTCSMDNDMQYG